MYENMVAPFRGILEWVDTPAGGVSKKGNDWKSVVFTLKYIDNNMSEKYIVFKLMGVEAVDRLLSVPLGTELRVTWRPGGSRFKRADGSLCWFAQNIAVSVTRTNGRNEAPTMPDAPAQESDDDMPY